MACSPDFCPRVGSYGRVWIRLFRHRGTAHEEADRLSAGFEDWLFHFVLPAAGYALLVVAAFAKDALAKNALLAVGAAALVLLFIGIHNAWDAVSYHVLVHIHGSKKAKHDNKRVEDEEK